MADDTTVYRVLTVFDAQTKGAESNVSGLIVTFDHLLALMERVKEMLASVLDLHGAAEQARTAIAGLLTAGGFPGADDFATSLQLADEIIKQMRVDARELPGEFKDLQHIFQFSIIGGAEAGKSIRQIERMAAQVMAVSKAFGLQSEVAGREFAMLMEGRAGAHIALFSKLKPFMGEGMTAEAFNQLSAPDKWRAIEKALAGFSPMVKEYGRTWEAVSSTAQDHLRTLLRVGTAPLFEGIKHALEGLNAWFEANQTTVEAYAQVVGKALADAFAWVLNILKAIGPPIADFFSGIGDVAKATFGTLKELVTSVSSVLSTVLGPAVGGRIADFRTLGEIVGTLLVTFGTYYAVVGVVTLATKAWAAAQAALDLVLAANPIGLVIAAVAALAAGVLVLVSYWDDLMDSMTESLDQPWMRSLMQRAGVIPAGATAADIDDAMGGARRAREQRRKRLEVEFGGSGVVAHVKALLQDQGLWNFGGPALAKGGEVAPKKDPIAALLDAVGRPVAGKGQTNITLHARIEQTVNHADEPGRVLIDTEQAIRDALIRPLESAGALVLR
jgi:hypothetical protein